MRRNLILCLGCLLIAFTGCKSSKESQYKAAFDKVKAQQEAQGQSQASEPVEITPIVNTSTSTTHAYSNETVRNEKVVLTSGTAGSLKAFSVVCGSFSIQENAEGVKRTLAGEGYNAIVVQNPTTKMYRVVCASFDDKAAAAQAKESFKAKHADNAEFQKAWLLYNN